MPVIREQRRVGLSLDAGGIVRADDSAADAWGAAARSAANLAGQMGQLLGEMAQDEAVALAASVEIGEDGALIQKAGEPQRAQMGMVAGRAFDRAALPRQRARVERTIADMVNRVRDEHQYDREGFEAAVAPLAEGMALGAPPELREMFRDASAQLISQAAGRIGWNQGQLERSQAASDFGVSSYHAAEDIWMAGLAGGPDAQARATAAFGQLAVQANDLLARGIITPAQRTKALVAAQAARGGAELLTELGDADAATLRGVQQALIMGDDDALNARFPDDDTRMQMARRLSGRITHLEGQERARIAAAEDYAGLSLVMRGGAQVTDKNRKLLDVGLADYLGYRPEPEHWMAGAVTDAAVYDQIRRSGMAPESLMGAFRMFTRGTATPQGVSNMVSLWKELSQGRFPDGSPSDLAGQLPDETVQRLMLTEHFLEGGMDVSQAATLAGEFAVKSVDLDRLAEKQGFTSQSFWRGATEATPERAKQLVRDGLRAEIEDRLGGRMGEADLKQAETVYAALVVGGNMDHADAVSAIGAQMEKRIPETAFIYEGPSRGWPARSNMAPEKHFSVPGDPGWFARWAEEEIRATISEDYHRDLTPEKFSFGSKGTFSLRPDMRATGSPVYELMADWEGDGGIPDVVLGLDGFPLKLDARRAYALRVAINRAVEIDAAGEAEVQRRADLAKNSEMAEGLRDARNAPLEPAPPMATNAEMAEGMKAARERSND